MISEQWLQMHTKRCRGLSNNDEWHELCNCIYSEYDAARKQAEDALELDKQSRNAVAVLQERLSRYEGVSSGARAQLAMAYERIRG